MRPHPRGRSGWPRSRRGARRAHTCSPSSCFGTWRRAFSLPSSGAALAGRGGGALQWYQVPHFFFIVRRLLKDVRYKGFFWISPLKGNDCGFFVLRDCNGFWKFEAGCSENRILNKRPRTNWERCGRVCFMIRLTFTQSPFPHPDLDGPWCEESWV